MAGKKFSQITPAGTPIAAADFLVGVQGGTVDVLFTPGEVGRTVLAADANYYVASTGSDSNNGSIGSPWLTLQHAVDFISTNIDMATFNIIVNIGAGSFVGFGLTALVGGGCLQFYGAGSASTTLTQVPSLFVTIQLGLITINAGASPSGSPTGINGATLTVNDINNDIIAIQSCNQSLVLGDNLGSATTDIKFSGNRGRSISIYNAGQLVVQPGTVTFDGSGATISGEIIGFGGAQIIFPGGATTLALTNTPNYTQFFMRLDNSTWGLKGAATITGAATGKTYAVIRNSFAEQSGGFPGNAAGEIDGASTIDIGGGPNVFIVSTLPSATLSKVGSQAFVTDSNATLAAGLGNIVATGAANIVPVYSDGTNWRIG